MSEQATTQLETRPETPEELDGLDLLELYLSLREQRHGLEQIYIDGRHSEVEEDWDDGPGVRRQLHTKIAEVSEALASFEAAFPDVVSIYNRVKQQK